MTNEKYFLRDIYKGQINRLQVREEEARMQLAAIRANAWTEKSLETELLELAEKQEVLNQQIYKLGLPPLCKECGYDTINCYCENWD